MKKIISIALATSMVTSTVYPINDSLKWCLGGMVTTFAVSGLAYWRLWKQCNSLDSMNRDLQTKLANYQQRVKLDRNSSTNTTSIHCILQPSDVCILSAPGSEMLMRVFAPDSEHHRQHYSDSIHKNTPIVSYEQGKCENGTKVFVEPMHLVNHERRACTLWHTLRQISG